MEWKDDWSRAPPKEHREYWETADIIHVHGLKKANWWFKCKKNVGFVLHVHGRRPRALAAMERKAARQRGGIMMVSTFNLLMHVHNNIDQWFPRPIDLDLFDKLRNGKINDDIIRVVHCPTIREYKSTDIFLEVMGEIQSEYKNVKTVLIEKMSNYGCITEKAKCDILFDQMMLSYGTNALEAWAFGMPVLCGANNYALGVMDEHLGYRPHIQVINKDELKGKLIELIKSKALRDKWGTIGRKYVEQFHSYPAAAAHAIKIYEKVLR